VKKLTSKQRARIVRGLEALALYIGNEEFEISHLVGHVEPEYEDVIESPEVPGDNPRKRSAAWLVLRVEGQPETIDALDIDGLAQLEQRSYPMSKPEMIEQVIDAVAKLGDAIDKGTNAD